jgi:hypothetical protein
MSKPPKAPKKISPEQARSIQEAADFLYALAMTIPEDSPDFSLAQRKKAIRHSIDLELIASPRRSERLEINVAMGYAIRKELAGPGKTKIARAETAKAHSVTDETVQAYYTRQREVAHRSVEVWVAESIDEVIKREHALRALLEHLGLKPRKHLSTVSG